MWVFLVLGLLLLFYLYRSRNGKYWEQRGVPTASGYNWFFGHYKPLVFPKKHLRNVFQDMYNEYPDAPVVGYLKMSTPGLVIKDLELVKAILSTDFGNFHKNEIMLDKENDFLFGNHPFNLVGEEWKATRAHVSPALTYAKLKGYLPAIVSVGDRMVKHIESKCNGRGLAEIETKALMDEYTTDVIANAVFGVENNSFETKDSLFANITKQLFKNSFIENLKLMTVFVFPGFISALKIRTSPKKVEDLLLGITQKILKDRMKDKAEGNATRNDAFHVIMSFKENDTRGVFTEKYIASILFTIMLDLHDTSSNVILYTLFELAWHNDVQEQLRKEILEMKSRTGENYNIDDIEKLKYLDMVFSESMRLLSAAPSMIKTCTEDYKFPLPGQNKTLIIEKGTFVHIPLYSIHTDSKYYPEPYKFDPNRFTEEEIAKRNKYSYLPFGEGPRKCLGQRITTLQIKVAIIKVVENFRLKPSGRTNHPMEIDPKVFFLTRPLNGAWIYFEKIKAH